ncbi:MAG: cytochrome c peroxidase [Pseudomonadota bacterium]
MDIHLPKPLADEDFLPVSRAEAELGRLLFYDPILSGNRNISCATCHHPRFATSDGLSLGLGEGGQDIGPDRQADPENLPEQRIPRNSPALFNLGAREMTVLFHDGRIEVDESRPSGFRTPLEDEMVSGFANLLSAQTMFPVLSPDEMAGHYQENDVAKAVRQGRITGKGGAWNIIADRVASIEDYRRAFTAIDPDIAAGRAIAFTDISDAIAAFVAFEWRSDDSPFDRFLRAGERLSAEASAGLALFYGRAGCSGCHTGALLADHRFYAMGTPQLGPGKAERFETHQRDVGRMRVTGRPEDAYAFRTPSLRNVARTGPWGHAGAHDNLGEFLRHHADPVRGLSEYEPQAVLPPLDAAGDWAIMATPTAWQELAQAVSAPPVTLSNEDIGALMAFLDSLTDETALEGRLGIPESVPSGLRVER